MKLVKRDPMKGYLDTWLWVPKQFANVEGVKNALTFEFADTYSEKKVRVLYLYQETEHHILVPRAFWDVDQLPYEILDCRPQEYLASPVTSKIKLDHKQDRLPDGSKAIVPTGKTVQQKSIDALLKSQGGILQLACGLGKTVVFLHLIALVGVPALIIVDNTQLMKQWHEEIERHLNVPGGIGIIQAEKNDWKKWVVLATYQTIAARAHQFTEEMRRYFGIVGWDEGHHVAAPTYAKGATLFPGRRFALTATPKRDDGTHVIYEYHIGTILYKDLTQDLKPRVIFRWTGLHVDETQAEVRDKNGELHLSKLGVYYGQWMERVNLVLGDAREFIKQGRKVLVLSNSVNEAINFLAVWNNHDSLYTDIPYPSPQEVGETLSPVFLTGKERKAKEKKLQQLLDRLDFINKRLMRNAKLTPPKKEQIRNNRTQCEEWRDQLQQLLKQAAVGRKIESEMRRRQKVYRKNLLEQATLGGLIISKVKPDQRATYLKTKNIVFAITKYGKEGLDDQALDTVMVSMPFSSRNGLQQVMGRPSRADNLKQEPLLIVYEDDIGPVIGMCDKLRRHLRDWPIEENGPFGCEFYQHPRRVERWQTSKVFGQS